MGKAISNGDIVIGLAFAIGGVGIISHASGLRTMPGMAVGSGLFPTITGALMILFGLVLAGGTLLRRMKAAPSANADTTTEIEGAGGLALSVYSLAVLAGLIALTLLVPTIGFLIGGTVFSATVCRLGGAGWIGSVLFGLALTGALYFVFVQGLGVQLPRGFWGA